MLIDKRMLASGIVMIAVGFSITFYLTETSPIGSANMTEDEKLDLIIEERENSDYRTLSGILIGVGFLLILISFGARRKKCYSKNQTALIVIMQLLSNHKLMSIPVLAGSFSQVLYSLN